MKYPKRFVIFLALAMLLSSVAFAGYDTDSVTGSYGTLNSTLNTTRDDDDLTNLSTTITGKWSGSSTTMVYAFEVIDYYSGKTYGETGTITKYNCTSVGDTRQTTNVINKAIVYGSVEVRGAETLWAQPTIYDA